MDSAKLSAEQIAAVAARVRPMTDYLVKLQGRMRTTEFPADDPLYQRVSAALEAMRMLSVELKQTQISKPIDLGPKPTRGRREEKKRER